MALAVILPRMRVKMPKVRISTETWEKVSRKHLENLGELVQPKRGYRVKRALGRGAFGKVYLAIDKKLNIPVVVKTVFPVPGVPYEEAFAILKNEIQILSKIQKFPFVPRLIEIGPDYYTQEDIKGTSMLTLLAKKGLPARTIAATAASASVMVGKLHEEGIAHRDLEPRNILLTPYGAALIDFGISTERSLDPKGFRTGMKEDIVSILGTLALGMSGRDVPDNLRLVIKDVIDKYRHLVTKDKVDERTATEMGKDLLFAVSQLSSRSARGKTIREQQIKVKVI